ncbi:hypothetical protein Scani_20550 [Streptomyces caniferus]|uniref:Uncharacterized protein n=1 Tax=Streptomyces caniferus TaxID=285557 RepID=A0A640S468_9ACTN|nr:hypothetical protein Scani_20550 [Streptomyces caniferus]
MSVSGYTLSITGTVPLERVHRAPYPVSHLAPGDVGTGRGDDTGEVQPHADREPPSGHDAQSPGANDRVESVHARRPDGYQHLARTGYGTVNLVDLQGGWRAEAGDLSGLHVMFLSGGLPVGQWGLVRKS